MKRVPGNLIMLILLIGTAQIVMAAKPDTAILPKGRPENFVWGINGHPLSQAAYIGNIEQQIGAIKKIGLSFYRVDIIPDSAGLVKDPIVERRLYALAERAAVSQVTLIPAIILPEKTVGSQFTTKEAAYAAGLIFGHGFASRYGRLFTYYELGNENDQLVIPSPPGDGSDSTSYDMGRLKLLAAFFRGMSDGIKQIDANAKIIISNSGWRHYGYFDLLGSEGVRYDIIGYHWYDGLQELRSVLDTLTTRFSSHPVWFTEINRRNNDRNDHNALRCRILQGYMSSIRGKGKNIRGLFIYELLDEPLLQGESEKYYGMTVWDPVRRCIRCKRCGRKIKRKIR